MKINPAYEQKITEIIEDMTIEEKVLQMLQISDQGNEPGVYEKFIELNTGSFLHELGESTDKLREKAKQTSSKIPPIFGIDAIHGHSLKNGATIFPSQLACACSWNEELIEEMGAMTAREVCADGIDWVFSPVLCMARDTRWGRVDETFGEDPHLIGKLGAAIVRGYERDGNVISCLKHYIGYGEATGARDAYDTEVSVRKIRETFLPPFEEAIKAGASSVMTAYGSISGTPLTKHKELLREILKEELGFCGFVVTDWFNIWSMRTKQRSAESFDESARLAIEAGNDMSMNCKEFFESVTQQVKNGEISEELINDSVRRILRVKMGLGLFGEKVRPDKSVIGCSEHRELNKKLTEESLVLLKNNGVLPLKEAPAKIALIGPNADDIVNQYGDWTFTSHRPSEEWAVIKNDYYTLLRGIKEIFADSEVTFAKGCDICGADSTDMEKALIAAKNSDVVILALGDELSQNGEGKDRAVLELSGLQNELAAKIKELGKPVITVFITGKPLCVREVCELSDAVIQAFNPGDLGGLCIAELIAGKFNPSGKLPISYPRASGAVPCYYNRYTGWHWGKYCDVDEGSLFDFGYGLSYTEFEYSDLSVSKKEIGAEEDFEVSVTVKNTGNMDGKEIVELYFKDMISSVMTPEKKLCAFKKINLAKGEAKRVTFKMNARDLAFVNPEGKWITEAGEFEIYAGGSLDTLLTAELSVK
ncbi:MAG: hypothetical protein E7608_02270 [Ruminococcaceae bacterium]|nr:hypothetical protein [Oscillospiraceae bacterium]